MMCGSTERGEANREEKVTYDSQEFPSKVAAYLKQLESGAEAGRFCYAGVLRLLHRPVWGAPENPWLDSQENWAVPPGCGTERGRCSLGVEPRLALAGVRRTAPYFQ